MDQALKSRGLDLHYTTWLRLVRFKDLPGKKIGGRYFIALDELDAWIALQGVGSSSSGAGGVTPAMTPQQAALVLSRRRRVSLGARGARGSGRKT